MKHPFSSILIVFLLGSCALFFTSCVGSDIRSSKAPESVLNPEPTAAPETNEVVPAASAAPPADKATEKPSIASHSAGWTAVQALPVVLAASVAAPPAISQPLPPVAAHFPQSFMGGTYGWPWLLLWLLLLLLLAQMVRARYQRDKTTLANSAKLAREEAAAKAAGSNEEENSAQWALLTDEVILGNDAKWTEEATAKTVRLADQERLAKEAQLAAEAAKAQAALLAQEEILVEGAGLAGMVKVAIKPGATFQEIIVSVAQIGNFPATEAHLFLENEDIPLNPNHRVEAKHPRHKIHHVHTQKKIGVVVHFNGHEHQTHFSPSTTVRKILAWAAKEFNIPNPEANEVTLSIRGSSEPLKHTAHIGRFVRHDENRAVLEMMAPAGVGG